MAADVRLWAKTGHLDFGMNQVLLRDNFRPYTQADAGHVLAADVGNVAAGTLG